VPGSIDSFKSTGTHFLIKQGAKLIENADDVLDEFGFDHGCLKEGDVLGESCDTAVDMEDSEKIIYEIIGDYPIHIDQIVRAGDMEAGEVLGILMKMELKGLVKQLPGKMFAR